MAAFTRRRHRRHESWFRARLENRASEPPRHEGTGVDIDAVRQNLWVRNRRMAVHDDFAEIDPACQEGLADPEEVLILLLLERHPRTYTGVADVVLANGERAPQRGEEIEMGRGDRLCQRACGRNIFSSASQVTDREPVRLHRLQP